MSKLTGTIDRETGRRLVDRLAEELARRGVTPEQVGRLSRVSAWQGLTKGDDGEPVLTDMVGFRLSPSWEDGPEWPVIQPGPVVKVPATRRKPAAGADTVVILPDMQIGFYRLRDETLEPTHDPAAIDAAIALIEHLQPTRIVMVGDNLDLPELGKYRTSPAFQRTTQATIDEATRVMARLRAAAPNATIDWLAGNHEERLCNWLMDNAKAAFGLRQGMSTDSWPVLSVPHLCRLDEQQVTYHPGYPAAELWLADDLKVIHGNRVKGRGSTAHVYLGESLGVSVLYGHIHRVELAYATTSTAHGPVRTMAASPGTLARIDGAVPSTNQGLDLDGRPLTKPENWQQGVGVVTLHEKRWQYECATIVDGVAMFRGVEFAA